MDSHPTPSNVILLVEVGDSTVGYDRTVKSRLYAAAGVSEYWIVDLDSDRMDVRLPRVMLDVHFVLGRPAPDHR